MKLKCPICNTEYDGITLVVGCPNCDWIISHGEEDGDDVFDTVNHMTPHRAKENYAKGLNIWGEPLSKK